VAGPGRPLRPILQFIPLVARATTPPTADSLGGRTGTWPGPLPSRSSRRQRRGVGILGRRFEQEE